MSPITSTLANGSAYGYRTLAAAGAAPAFESIATFTGNGSANSVTFSSIPQTYTSLQIRCFGMVTLGISTNRLKLNFNGDTGSNYAYHSLIGDGSTVFTESGISQTAIDNMGTVMGSSYAPAPTIIDIHDYTATSRNKTVRSFTGADGNIASASFRILLSSGLWMNTSAITSIDVALTNGSLAFTTSSVISLYGIKGA
jgi:hypothetical protein